MRSRLYTVIWLKARVAMVHDIRATYDRASQMVRQWQPVLSLSSVYTCDQQLLVTAENAARATRNLPCLTKASSDWTYLLNKSETKHLHTYVTMWLAKRGTEPHTDKNCVFNLGQNPKKRCCWTNRQGVMPTLTYASRKLWSPYLHRWLIPSELATTMGLNTGADPAVDLYSAQVLGNAMNVASVGAVLSCTLACIRPIET